MRYLAILAILVFVLLACSLGTSPQTFSQGPTKPLVAGGPSLAQTTAASTASQTTDLSTAAVTKTPGPSETPKPTFPPELTRTPGIMATATAYSALATAYQQTNAALLGPLADMFGINQYFNPVGTPLQTWYDIPVMPQATAGQEFRPDIYSYKASASLSQATQFYRGQAGTLHWSCSDPATGSAGSGSNASHAVTFLCQSMVISITSFDNDAQHVIVVINKPA